MRTEDEVFQDLAQLCVTDGYVHVIAYFCSRDNLIFYKDKLTAKDLEHQSSWERLIRTEISTLIGLMCKAVVSLEIPKSSVLEELITKTEALLSELHDTLLHPVLLDSQTLESMQKSEVGSFASGMAMREPIFYAAESAYDFQYRELSFRKYKKDANWFEREKGFSLDDAKKILDVLAQVQAEHLQETRINISKQRPELQTMLPVYTLSSEDFVRWTGLSPEVVNRFLKEFSLKPDSNCNEQFGSLNEFNQINSTPLINLDDKFFLLFHSYSLYEAFYETPFFWMNSDKPYRNEAMKNRGDFLEQYSADRLRSVFGNARVFENVHIWGSGRDEVAEIDVLVVFANRAIILQAKTKRLTIEARKGNDSQLKDDFKKSIQDSYDQGLLCAKCLNDPSYVYKDSTGNIIKIKPSFNEIYIFCVVSDHYPALSFQANQFLKIEETEFIKPPFVIDVFLLDVLSEMLPSPLYFLSYINRRVGYADRIVSNHELVNLSYHLKQNLWVEDETSLMILDDSISADLDIAMAVRRTGISGAATPSGILTKLGDSPVKKLLTQIEHLEDPAVIDFGFLILHLSGEALEDLGKAMGQMSRKANAQKNHHDLTVSVGDSGMTMHFSHDASKVAAKRLKEHCEKRKYTSKAKSWFGLCITPVSFQVRFGLKLNYPWKQSDTMDEVTKEMLVGNKTLEQAMSSQVKHKVGRNDPCICGSGKKYKKCCL